MIQHFHTSVKSSNISTCTYPQGPLHFNSNTYFVMDKLHLNTCQLSPMHTDKTTQLWTANPQVILQGTKWNISYALEVAMAGRKLWIWYEFWVLCNSDACHRRQAEETFCVPKCSNNSHIESQLRKSERLALLQDLRVSWEKQWIWLSCIRC